MKKPAIPFGFQDILPAEASQRRRLESKFRQAFTRFGFGEVITPTVEHYDLLTTESGDQLAQNMIKLVANGQLLALRPEMTTPLARLTAQRLAYEPLPLRLFYLTNVFRDELPEQGQKREFWQVGAELIGEESLLAEAELLLLLNELLKVSGLKSWRIALSEPNFIRLNLEAINIKRAKQEQILACLVRKSLVGYEQQIASLALPEQTKVKLKQLPYLKGEPKACLDEAKKLALSSKAAHILEKLQELVNLIEEFNLVNLEFDFSLVKNLAYYTGIIFEVYAAGAGLSLGGGGRYDHLLTAFSEQAQNKEESSLPLSTQLKRQSKPAIGFALNFDRLELALTNQGALQPKENIHYFVFSQKPSVSLLKTALQLQEQKVSYHLCFQALKQTDAFKQAQAKGCRYLLEVKSGGKTVEVKVE